MSEIIVGLDIGSKQVNVVAGRLDHLGKLEILGLGKADTTGQVSKGVVLNVNKTIEAVQSAIEQVENQANIHIRGVFASVAGPNIHCTKQKSTITRQTSGEEVTVTDVDQVANDAKRTFISKGNAIVHTFPQEYFVDSIGNIYDPVGISGLKLQGDFLMVTSPQGEFDKTKRCIESAKEKMEIEGGLVFSPLAASLAVLTPQEKKSGVCLVDIGSGMTEIAIFHKGIVRHIAVLPFAGDAITADIEQGCGISTEYAEQLKIKFGCAIADEIAVEEVVLIPGINGRKTKNISVKNLGIIIEERLKEIVALVEAEISRCGYGNRLNCGIVLTGGTVQMSYIGELFERVTNRDVRIGHPNENLGKTISEEIKNPTYATAVGLVWKGVKSIDEREDIYKELRKDAPPIVVVPVTPINVGSNNGKKVPEKEKEKTGWNIFGSAKKIMGKIIGDGLGDSDAYEKKVIMAKHLETGKRAEDLAAAFLVDKGYEIIARNYRSGHAEIDLIVKKDIFLVFVEVKSLYNIKFGNPEVNVTREKAKLVTRAAGNYVYYNNWHQQIRFDIISIIFRTEEDFDITHFEDAFY